MRTIQLFQDAAERQSFAAGEIIFYEGELGSLMYIIVSGEVEITLHGRVLDTIGAGGIIGEMALMMQHLVVRQQLPAPRVCWCRSMSSASPSWSGRHPCSPCR